VLVGWPWPRVGRLDSLDGDDSLNERDIEGLFRTLMNERLRPSAKRMYRIMVVGS